MQSDAWYVASTFPRSEAFAEANLKRQGFDAFCPRFRKTRRHARRIDQVLSPVFPGYIFVHFDRERDQWRSVNGTHGIMSLVGPSSFQPQAMPDRVMELLLSRCEGGVMRCVLPELEKGQIVRLMAGPFADQLATIEHVDSKGRVRVLMEILGGQSSVMVGLQDLAPV